jgi:hypothetical protein
MLAKSLAPGGRLRLDFEYARTWRRSVCRPLPRTRAQPCIKRKFVTGPVSNFY